MGYNEDASKEQAALDLANFNEQQPNAPSAFQHPSGIDTSTSGGAAAKKVVKGTKG